MNILVTAGNTLVPIDRVRGITNIFTGRTGTRIALQAHERGHHVTLLTSHPEVVAEERDTQAAPAERWSVWAYHTFVHLQDHLHNLVSQGGLDAIIHCAAVSDYQPAGIYAPDATTHFRIQDGHWESSAPSPPTLVDRAAGKVKSDEPELWLRLVRTPKLIDRIRFDWGFRGILVKFKLEVGIGEEELLTIAERSRRQSAADLMVANTLEGAPYWAYLGPLEGTYQRVNRADLAGRLLDAVERVYKEGDHG